MSAPYLQPLSTLDEARALLADSRVLLDRFESFIDRLGQYPTGMTYARPHDELPPLRRSFSNMIA